jgi:hypothetical protein
MTVTFICKVNMPSRPFTRLLNGYWTTGQAADPASWVGAGNAKVHAEAELATYLDLVDSSGKLAVEEIGDMRVADLSLMRKI